jgi:hypothetical protein
MEFNELMQSFAAKYGGRLSFRRGAKHPIGQKLAQRQNAYIQEVINQPNKFSEKHKDDISKVGTATIAQRTTIDLTQKPLPVVTDVTFSQTFSPDEIRLTSDQ